MTDIIELTALDLEDLWDYAADFPPLPIFGGGVSC